MEKPHKGKLRDKVWVPEYLPVSADEKFEICLRCGCVVASSPEAKRIHRHWHVWTWYRVERLHRALVRLYIHVRKK